MGNWPVQSNKKRPQLVQIKALHLIIEISTVGAATSSLNGKFNKKVIGEFWS